MPDTNVYGTITELKCKTYFLELGYLTSTPDTPSRYDFILDAGDRLLKIQVKSCHFIDGKIVFKTESSHITSNGSNRRSYKNEIDYFCTWYENECYLIPVEECGRGTKSLRLEPTKNGQVKNISFANDYLAKEVLSR
jgi:hypothetical protein